MISQMNSWLRELGKTLSLAIPIMIGQIGHMLMGISDTVLVGGVGVIPLAAAAFANSIINVFLVFGLGLLAGVSVLISRAYGAKEAGTVAQILRHGMLIASVIGLLLGIGIWLISTFFLQHFGQETEVINQARPFLIITGWSILPALTWQCLRQYCESLNHSVEPMVVMLFGVALNTFLGWAMIYGHCGFRVMGLYGAGLSTLVARLAMLFVQIGIVKYHSYFKSTLPKHWFKKFSMEPIRNLLELGIPVSAQLLLEVTAFAAAAMFMGTIGSHYLAAHQVTIICASTAFMLPYGLSIALSVRVAQAVGAKAFYKIRVIGYSAIALAIVLMFCTAGTFFFFGPTLASWFVHDQGVIALAAQMFVIAGFFQVFDGLQVVCMGALRGLSDVRVPLFIAFFAYWGVAIPIVGIFSFVLRNHSLQAALSIWWGLAAGLAFAAMALIFRFQRKTTYLTSAIDLEKEPEVPVLEVLESDIEI